MHSFWMIQVCLSQFGIAGISTNVLLEPQKCVITFPTWRNLMTRLIKGNCVEEKKTWTSMDTHTLLSARNNIIKVIAAASKDVRNCSLLCTNFVSAPLRRQGRPSHSENQGQLECVLRWSYFLLVEYQVSCVSLCYSGDKRKKEFLFPLRFT